MASARQCSVVKTAIWAEHFGDRDIDEVVEVVASLGYDAVAITPWRYGGPEPTMDRETIDAITDAVDRHGIEVAGTARTFGPTHVYSVTSPDESERERVRRYLEALVALCGELGGSAIAFGVGDHRRHAEDVSYGAAWDYALDVFGSESLHATLEAHDVRIGIEPLSPAATNFLNTTLETVRFVEAVDHPHVGMTVDGYHLVSEPGTPAELVRECGGHLVEFHADDPNGFGPGSGEQDYEAIYHALNDVDFDGYVTVEFHAFLGDEIPDEDPIELAERSLDYLRSVRS